MKPSHEPPLGSMGHSSRQTKVIFPKVLFYNLFFVKPLKRFKKVFFWFYPQGLGCGKWTRIAFPLMPWPVPSHKWNSTIWRSALSPHVNVKAVKRQKDASWRGGCSVCPFFPEGWNVAAINNSPEFQFCEWGGVDFLQGKLIGVWAEFLWYFRLILEGAWATIVVWKGIGGFPEFGG